MRRQPDNLPRTYRVWALQGPRNLPIVYRTRQQAESDAEPDEALYRCTVTLERRLPKRTRPYDGSPF